MKKVLQVNLGGVAFTVDDDAYRRLDGYMLDLERYFASSGNQDDIMADIESRIAEIFSELLKSRKIVEITDVEAAIKIMGTPADFGDASYVGDPGRRGTWDIKTGKKLFRDPNDKMIGGICSGLAAYFGIQEVLWVRLAFALLAFTTGTTIVAYIILWILVPEAKTAADKLSMMGEQANAQNIARMVERGIEDLSSTIKDNWKQWHSKKKSQESRFDGMSNQSDKPLFVLLFVVIPLLIISKVGDTLVKVVRRVLFSRSMTRARNQFV